jgi:hypothetical protein
MLIRDDLKDQSVLAPRTIRLATPKTLKEGSDFEVCALSQRLAGAVPLTTVETTS